jgi:hypothetical protein
MSRTLTAATAFALGRGANQQPNETKTVATNLQEAVLNRPLTWLAVAGIGVWAFKRFGTALTDVVAGDPIKKATTSTKANPWAFESFFRTAIPKGVRYKVFTDAYAKDRATQLSKSISWFPGGDDETFIKLEFRNYPSKAHVAQICRAYLQLFSDDLLRLLTDGRGLSGTVGTGGLSEADLKEVLRTVEQKPDYIKA